MADDIRQPALVAEPHARAQGIVADLSPASFGLVMATGIVSLGAHLRGWPHLALGLFVFNLAAYGALWLLTLARIAAHPRRVLDDMTDHARAPGYFTTVAATSLVGSQLIVLSASYRAAGVLWIIAVALWVSLTYAIFAALTVKSRKPSLEQGIGGAWLLGVVATQSIAVLSTLLAGHVEAIGKPVLDFVALSMWLCGDVLYIWIMALIFYRCTFLPLAPADLSPSYWISMGAMAISTLAGALLVVDAGDVSSLASMLPFIRGVTLLCWATATWWIPLLAILTAWRHGVRRHPFTYEVSYWGAVFPLGMYAAGTHEMVVAFGFDFLAALPTVFLCLALLAWVATFAGLARHALRHFEATRRRRHAAS